MNVWDEIEKEIDYLRRRHGAILRQQPEAQEVPARWAVETSALCWFVPLEEVVEPDIDVEIEPEVLIVRARRTAPDPAVLIGILPVPGGFDPSSPRIRFVRQTLEIHLHRTRGGSAR